MLSPPARRFGRSIVLLLPLGLLGCDNTVPVPLAPRVVVIQVLDRDPATDALSLQATLGTESYRRDLRAADLAADGRFALQLPDDVPGPLELGFSARERGCLRQSATASVTADGVRQDVAVRLRALGEPGCSVKATGSAGGTIYISQQGPPRSACTESDGTCQVIYQGASQVLLEATPSSGYLLQGWTQDAAVCGSQTSCQLPISTEAGKRVAAVFVKKPHPCDSAGFVRVPGITAPMDFFSVWGTADMQLIRVTGLGAVLDRKGTTWDAAVTSRTGFSHRGIWGTVASDQWLVGTGPTGNNATRFTTAFADYPLGAAGDSFNAVWGTTLRYFAVGDGGKIYSVASGMTTWTPQTSGIGAALRGVWGTSESNVIAVGDSNNALRYDGAAWSPLALPGGLGTVTLGGVHGNASSVWLVGSKSTVLHGQADGSAISSVGAGTFTGRNLNKVWVGSTRIYVVGDAGTILCTDPAASEWRELLVGGAKITSNLSGIWGVGDKVWAVGSKDATGNGMLIESQ